MSEPVVSWTDEDVRVFLQTYGRAPTRLMVRQLPSWWLNIVNFLNEIARRPVAADEPVLRDLVERIQQAVRNFEARIAPFSESLPRGVVHHDAHCKNVLFRGDQLIALIDFDDAHEGYLVA